MEELNKEVLTNELRNKTLNFFKTNNIQLPIPVENAINDVFDENDFTSDEEDVVNIYFKEDLEDFYSDTICLKQLNVQVKGGNSSGDILDKYTYYDNELDTSEGYSEDIGLYDGEEKINQISLVIPTGTNKLEDENDYCVVMIEESEFHMGEYRVIPRLYIYLPASGENIE